MSSRTWKFKDLVLAILDLIMKGFEPSLSGMEPSFNYRHRTLDKRQLEANAVRNITFYSYAFYLYESNVVAGGRIYALICFSIYSYTNVKALLCARTPYIHVT